MSRCNRAAVRKLHAERFSVSYHWGFGIRDNTLFLLPNFNVEPGVMNSPLQIPARERLTAVVST